MNYTGQTSFAEMFEYYCNRNVTNEREYNEREMLRWVKQQLTSARRDATEEVAKAHKRGWEQFQKRAVKECHAHRSAYGLGVEYIADSIGRCIAAMEYGGKAND